MASRAARITTISGALAALAGAAQAAAPTIAPERDFPSLLVILAIVAALVVAGVFVFRLVRASRRR